MIVEQIHKYVHQLPRYQYLSDTSTNINHRANGLYFIFEAGEIFGDYDRVVRVGSHTGKGNLMHRINEHFTTENKDRSIFRKNVGRSILNARQDPYLPVWEIDFTTKANKLKYGGQLKDEFQAGVEREVSQHMRNKMSYSLLLLPDGVNPIIWESKLIGTLAQGRNTLKPSKDWLGNSSTKNQIKEYGLWQIQHLKSPAMTSIEWYELQKLANK